MSINYTFGLAGRTISDFHRNNTVGITTPHGRWDWTRLLNIGGQSVICVASSFGVRDSLTHSYTCIH